MSDDANINYDPDNDESSIPGDPAAPQQGQPQAGPLMPDVLVPKQLTRDQLKRQLQARFGIEPDEADTLYPADSNAPDPDAKLREFYEQVARHASELDGNMEDEPGDKVKKDDYKLSKKEQVALADVRLAQERLEKRRAAKARKIQALEAKFNKAAAPVVAEIKEQAEKQAFEQAGQHLPKEDRVSWDDARKAMEALVAKRKKVKSKKSKK